jgi:hypothetical protein
VEGRAMTGYSPEFDWNPSSDTEHSIVVRHQPAIAVYLNPHDEVVVRQQDQYDESDDHFVFITKDNVPKVVERMLELAGLEMATHAAPLMLPKPEPLSGAERQRRYRNKHRNGNGDVERHDSDELPLLLAHGTEDQQELAG